MITDSPDGTQGDLESPGGSPITEILDKVYAYGYRMGRDGKTDGTHEPFNLAIANNEALAWINTAIGEDEDFYRDGSHETYRIIGRNQLRAELRRKLGIEGDTQTS